MLYIKGRSAFRRFKLACTAYIFTISTLELILTWSNFKDMRLGFKPFYV